MMIMKSTIKRKKKGRVGCQGEERSFREKERKGPGKKVQNLNFYFQSNFFFGSSLVHLNGHENFLSVFFINL